MLWGKTGKKGNSKNWNSVFSIKHMHCRWVLIFVLTYRVTNFLPKLVDMLLFSAGKKTEFPFFVFPYFPVLPCYDVWCFVFSVPEMKRNTDTITDRENCGTAAIQAFLQLRCIHWQNCSAPSINNLFFCDSVREFASHFAGQFRCRGSWICEKLQSRIFLCCEETWMEVCKNEIVVCSLFCDLFYFHEDVVPSSDAWS